MAASRTLLVLASWLALVAPVAGQARAPHDLTVSRGANAADAPALCDFCHAPHNDQPSQALWSRELQGVTYKLYESSTLRASLNQPTGVSRLCLSCHDGTVALPAIGDGNGKPARIAGKALLGTDLSDDHPISFTYDAALAARNGELVDPRLLPQSIGLDQDGQLQCTACHEPHASSFRRSLVIDDRFSQLCVSCHQIRGWAASVHARSSSTWKGVGPDPAPSSELKTVAERGCGSCHSLHSAPRPEWLLHSGAEEKNCFTCHNGSLASKDLERDFRKFSAHPVEQTEWIHRPREDPLLMQRHVTCDDCHNPHTVEPGRGRLAAPSPPGALRGVKGASASGARLGEASFEYEVCYACHGLAEQARAAATRQDHVTNVRLELDPSNESYHPVVAPGRNHDVTGFEGGYNASSMIYCVDCHASDSAISSAGTRGPHGSIYEPILEREYQMADPSPESFQAYALCYKCHDRAALLSDRGGFPHRRHVVELQTSCAVCHDAHGSRRNGRLINFMTRGKTGTVVVSSSSGGTLAFEELGRNGGRCFLTCHGSDHNPKSYR